MIIDFRFGKATGLKFGKYEIDFSIVGTTQLWQSDMIKASQPGGSMEHIRQKVLAELVALLQLELYGRVMSNETGETAGNQPQPDSKTSQTDGGLNTQSGENEAEGDNRPDTGDDTASTYFAAEAEGLEAAAEDLEKAAWGSSENFPEETN